MCTLHPRKRDEDCAWKVIQTSIHRVRGARGESAFPGSIHVDMARPVLPMRQVLWPWPSPQVWRKQAWSCVNQFLLSSNVKPSNLSLLHSFPAFLSTDGGMVLAAELHSCKLSWNRTTTVVQRQCRDRNRAFRASTM